MKRNHKLSIWLTDEEKKKLLARCEALGLSLAVYIRACALNSKITFEDA